MKGRLNVPLRMAAVTASAALMTMTVAAPALAAEGDVQVVNTETVQVYTDATGAVQTKRIYEQIALTGNGDVELRNPIATDGLRNLDGFGGFSVEDGEQVASVSVDGDRRLRTVSDFDGDLPLEVQARYFLDGEPIEPSDVVGKDGQLEVRYTVKNVTAAPQELTFDDGDGGTVTRTVEVPIPMVGSLTLTAPSNFTDVRSDQANMAGDGKGGTRLSFTMTLFPPIGSDTAEFGYTANISDGVVPRASITVLPVNPLESPSFAAAGESYKGGADTGIELAAGASEIDANLLRLRDGAAELLAGLIQLRDGAQQLNAGLAGEAAPGAARLAAGSSELAGGLGQIDDGAGRLSAGASELSSGAGRLGGGITLVDDGAKQLAAGAGELSAGAARLGGGVNLVDDGAQQLAVGGSALSEGTAQLAAGTRRLSAGTTALSDGTGAALAGSQALASGAGQLSAGVGELGTGAAQLDGGAAQLAAGQEALVEALQLLRAGVASLPQSVQDSLAANADYQRFLGALGGIAAGAGTLQDGPADETLLGGLQKLRYGLDNPLATAEACEDGDVSRCGATDALDYIVTQLDGALVGPAEETGTVAALEAAILDIKNPPTGYPGVWCDAGCQLKVDATAEAVAAAQTASLTDLRDGLATISGGVKQNITAPGAGIDRIRAGLSTGVDPSTCATNPAGCGIREAALFLQLYGTPALVQGIVQGISDGLLSNIGTATPDCDPQRTLLCAAAALADGSSELSQGMKALVAGVAKLNEGGAALSVGAGDLAAGLTLIDAGANELNAGAGELEAGASQLNDGAGRLAAGAGSLADGTGQLAAGSSQLNDGAGRLAAGAGDLADGTGQLAAGAPQLVDGAGRLAAGAGELKAGTGRASDGANQIADGANQLATGLGDAADGSGRLADGLVTAADGAPRIVDGAGRLSEEGTSKLVEAGEATAQNYGEMYATIQAGAERAQTEKMVFGAPEGAIGLAAYSYEIKGENGEGSRNVARGLGGLAVLAAGAAAFGLRRKLI